MGRNNAAAIILGIIVLVLGIILKLYVGRRRFYRRNQAGLEGFTNYRNSLITPFLENILNFVGSLLIAIGVICIGTAIMVGR